MLLYPTPALTSHEFRGVQHALPPPPPSSLHPVQRSFSLQRNRSARHGAVYTRAGDNGNGALQQLASLQESQREEVQRAMEQKVMQAPSPVNNVADVVQKPTGVPEVVFGTGKSPDQLANSLETIATRQRVVLATRVDPSMYAAVRKLLKGVEYNARARLLMYRSPDAEHLPKTERLPGTVAVVSGGAADQPVAEECRLVAQNLGLFAFAMEGMVVTSINRLLGSMEALRAADVVVVVSGMDGSLAPLVAGLVDSPVIGVPTSAGYGASMGGVAPLLSQLSSSVPGISCTGIDNGFGGAVCAYKALRMAHKLHTARSVAELQALQQTAGSQQHGQ